MIIFTLMSLQARFEKAVAFLNDFLAQLDYDGVSVRKTWLPPVVDLENRDALKKGIKVTFNHYWAARRWLSTRDTDVSIETKLHYDGEARLLECILLFGDDRGILPCNIVMMDATKRPEIIDKEEEPLPSDEGEYTPPSDEYRLSDASDVIPDDYDGYDWHYDEEDVPAAVSA